MTTEEGIVWFASTGVGSLLIGAWLTRKRDKFEVYIKEQSFYKSLIADLKAEREADSQEIQTLTGEITSLKVQIQKLLDLDKKQKQTIEQHEQTIVKWEHYAEGLKTTISDLITEIESK